MSKWFNITFYRNNCDIIVPDDKGEPLANKESYVDIVCIYLK